MEQDSYEHTLKVTRCDYCAAKTKRPISFRFEGTWRLWFFCKKEHQYAFGRRGPDGYVTPH
jgi:hypothetical protein